jgi:hypothetical protein
MSNMQDHIGAAAKYNKQMKSHKKVVGMITGTIGLFTLFCLRGPAVPELSELSAGSTVEILQPKLFVLHSARPNNYV